MRGDAESSALHPVTELEVREAVGELPSGGVDVSAALW